MKLCIDRYFPIAESLLYEFCVDREKLWLTVGYVKFCVDGDLNRNRKLFT